MELTRKCGFLGSKTDNPSEKDVDEYLEQSDYDTDESDTGCDSDS